MATPDQVARLDAVDPQLLGRRIRDHRRAAGLGQAEVATGTGVSISFVSRIESGKRRCDLGLLTRIADLLGVPVDRFLAEPLQPTGPRIADDRLELARIALAIGETGTALDLLDRVRAESEKPDREWLLLRGRALESVGRLQEGIEELERIPVPGPEPLADVAVAIALSRCYREAGEYVRAVRAGEETLSALGAAGLGGCDEAVQLAVTVAAAYFEQGDREYAVRLCRRTLDAAERLGTPRARAAAYWNHATMEHERGDSAAALPMARRAQALLSEGQDERNLARLQAQLGLMELRISPPDLESAARHFERARAGFLTSDASEVDLQRLDICQARLALLAGDPRSALDLARDVVRRAGRLPRVEAEARGVAGEAALMLDDVDAARQEFLGAVQLLAGIDDVRGIAQTWLELGAHLQDLDEVGAAADAYRRAAVAAGLTVPATSSAPARMVVRPTGG